MHETVPLACDLSALPDPARYRTLRDRLHSAISGSAELADGYSFSLNGRILSLTELGEWIALERCCCPFLNFELSITGTDSLYWLTLTGPEGTKAVLEREFSL